MATSSLLVTVATIAAIWALFALGLNIKFGYTGLLDFGHVAFFLVGAYTTALLVAPPAGTKPYSEYILGVDLPARLVELTGLELASGLGWLIALFVGTVVAGMFGLLVALPAIRLREDYLAIALLGISVIAKRTVQTETWLANGPDALRGYPRPLTTLFPLPGVTVEGTVLFGGIVFVFWTIAVYLLAREASLDDGFGSADVRTLLLNGAFAVLTLGFGYVAARRSRAMSRDEQTATSALSTVPILGAGLIAALLGAGLGAFAYDFLGVLLTLGTLSVFVWVYAGVVTRRHFDHVPRQDWLIALGIAAGVIVVFVPGTLVDAGPFGTQGLVPTTVLLVAFVAGVTLLLRNWSWFDTDTSRLSLLGVVGVWLFVFRYFLLSSVEALLGGGTVQANVRSAASVLLEDILFLVQYQGSTLTAGVQFDYQRFLFVFVVTFLVLGYLLSELTVRSPYGRVLKAIREDEDVAMSLGKNTFSYKVQSMILGSAMAGLAGGLVAIYYGTLTFRNFEPLLTFFMFLIVVIGGTANNKGVILGAALYWAFVRGSVDIAAVVPGDVPVFALRVVLLGAVFIAILYYRPQGIWGERTVVPGGVEE